MKQKTAKQIQDDKNKEFQQELARRRRKELLDKAAVNDHSSSLRASNQDKLKRFRLV